MKKFFVLLILTFLLIHPCFVQALSVRSSSISSGGEQEVGATFPIKIHFSFDHVDKSHGVAAVVYQLEFDESIFSLTGKVDSPGYSSSVVSSDGEYFVVSAVDEDSSYGKCRDGILSCTDYDAEVYVYVKRANKTYTYIELVEVDVGYFIMLDDEYIEDDVDVEIYQNQYITVKSNSKGTATTEPKSTVVSGDNVDLGETIGSVDVSEKPVGSKYLKELKIDGYPIDFRKKRFTYQINVPQSVNKLDVSADVEDEKATFEIIGADDLKKSNDKVRVKVTSASGEKTTYDINIVRQNLDDKEAKHIISNLNLIFLIAGGVFVLIIFLMIVSSIHNKRALNRMLKDENL